MRNVVRRAFAPARTATAAMEGRAVDWRRIAAKPWTFGGSCGSMSVVMERAMGLYELFFPEQAQADHLQEIARVQQAQLRRSIRSDTDGQSRLAALEKDMGFIALILGSILQRLDQKGIVTRDEIKQEMSALDELDGVKDGRLDVNILRGQQS
jgi:hypothetical protein